MYWWEEDREIEAGKLTLSGACKHKEKLERPGIIVSFMHLNFKNNSWTSKESGDLATEFWTLYRESPNSNFNNRIIENLQSELIFNGPDSNKIPDFL